MKDIEIIDIDYSASDLKFKKEDKIDVSKLPGPFIVPEEGPFYDRSVRLLNGGTPLVNGKDYEIIEPVTELTELTGKGVSLYISLKDHILTNVSTLDFIYQKVGNPVFSRSKLVQLLEDLIITGKPIDWETQVSNKPKTYPASQHSMDVTKPEEVIGFGDMVQLFKILSAMELKNGSKVSQALQELQSNIYNKLDYIQKLRWGSIMGHSRNYGNPHGIVPLDVQCENIANYPTATPQQDSEGTRSDLYSTPAGLKRILSESEPDSEEFLMQNETPFSYYGSGIYLPPPITGSFEGLGQDKELGCFCLEGNGWVVGLYRCFDGRVCNLYYMYDDSGMVLPGTGNWKPTYVQYQHPTITAAGCRPNAIISGSGSEILMVADAGKEATPKYRYWICNPNSTFDPASHDMKEIDMSEVFLRGSDAKVVAIDGGNVFKMGDWVYFLMFNGEVNGSFPSNYSPNNHAGWVFRFPYSQLNDKNVKTVKFTRVNVNFDDINRVRHNNDVALFLDTPSFAPDGKITKMLCTFSRPVNSMFSHRRRTVIAIENPNDKNKGRIRIMFLVWFSYTNLTGGPQSGQCFICVDYNFDANTNTFTLDPRFVPMTYDIDKQDFINLTSDQRVRQVVVNGMTQLQGSNITVCVSKIPGYGVYAYVSFYDGGLPGAVNKVMFNQSGDPNLDWESYDKPQFQVLSDQKDNARDTFVPMISPFGVAGYPRWYSDIYEVNGQMRTEPIEVFSALDSNIGDTSFYRETEPGGTSYITRPELNNAYLGQLAGRKTNSKFGKVVNHSPVLPFVNNPKVKNEHSRQLGIFTHFRTRIGLSGNSEYFSEVIDPTTNKTGPIVPDGQGYIKLPLLGTHTLLNGTLTIKATPARSVAIPRSLWRDWINNLIGADLSQCVDIITSFFISSKSGYNVCPSLMTVVYHTKAAPRVVRCICARFYWEVTGTLPDGTRIINFVTIDYPSSSDINSNPMDPGIPNNILATAEQNDIRLAPDGSWEVVYLPGVFLTSPTCQILEFSEEGPQSYEIWFSPGWRLVTLGYSVFPRLTFNVRRGVFNGSGMNLPYGGAYVSGSTMYVANPDYGWTQGVNYNDTAGGAMCLFRALSNNQLIMQGATYVEGNWAVFVVSPVVATFNGRSITVQPTNFDLRDYSTVYKNRVFYMYCVSKGSVATYELSKLLREPNGDQILVAKITTDDLGIVKIERYQKFAMAGYPITWTRDPGIPVTSGSLWERGSYLFLKQSELYSGT